MFERILIPLDGSPRAELILGQVGRVLWRKDSEIILLRIIDLPNLENDLLTGRRMNYPAMVDREREEAERYIHDLALRFREQGAKVQGRIAEGPAAETILEQSTVEGATLIAIATHGRTGLSRFIFGSVAEKVLRGSRIPVLLVRSFRRDLHGDLEPATATELRFRKILVPTDGSPASLAAVDSAKTFAQLFDSEILVFHADWPLILPGTELGAMPILPPTASKQDPVTLQVSERFSQAGLRTTRLTALGDPAGEILDQSREAGIDLIAMSTHGRSGLSRWVLGSVAERVLRHAEVPLLVVRAAGEKMELEWRERGEKTAIPTRA